MHPLQKEELSFLKNFIAIIHDTDIYCNKKGLWYFILLDQNIPPPLIQQNNDHGRRARPPVPHSLSTRLPSLPKLAMGAWPPNLKKSFNKPLERGVREIKKIGRKKFLRR